MEKKIKDLEKFIEFLKKRANNLIDKDEHWNAMLIKRDIETIKFIIEKIRDSND